MTDTTTTEFLDSVEGEISFFRAIMRARPVGRHRHFHVIQIRTAMHRDTGTWVPIDDIWAKLRSCYELESLDSLDENGDRDDFVNSDDTTNTAKTPSPLPTENLAVHPHFEQEFTLPRSPSYEAILSARRMRDSESIDTPPRELSPPLPRGKRKRTRSSKARAGGLVGGDSDSSLTDQSMEEPVPHSPRGESVATGTDDVPTDVQEEDVEMEVTSPSVPPKPVKVKETRSHQKKATTARTRSAAASNARSKKKKK